jgi:hypothetical protein
LEAPLSGIDIFLGPDLESDLNHAPSLLGTRSSHLEGDNAAKWTDWVGTLHQADVLDAPDRSCASSTGSNVDSQRLWEAVSTTMLLIRNSLMCNIDRLTKSWLAALLRPLLPGTLVAMVVALKAPVAAVSIWQVIGPAPSAWGAVSLAATVK